MSRFRTSFLTLIVLPVVAFSAEPNVVMLPGTTVPAYAGATTPAMLTQPLAVDPNVHFPSEYATGCPPRVGVLKSMMNWICAPKATCATGTCATATCNATANYKPPVVAVAKVHHVKATVVRDNACLDKLKAWFCWHPSKELGMPSFLAAPYQSPVRAYFRDCTEPAMGCNTGCVASGCAVGPAFAATVVQQTSLPGQTLMPGYRFAKATATPSTVKVAPSAIVPVGYVAPVGPVAPKPNLLVRPFTNP